MPEGTNYIALCITLAIAIFLGNGMLLIAEKACVIPPFITEVLNRD